MIIFRFQRAEPWGCRIGKSIIIWASWSEYTLWIPSPPPNTFVWDPICLPRAFYGAFHMHICYGVSTERRAQYIYQRRLDWVSNPFRLYSSTHRRWGAVQEEMRVWRAWGSKQVWWPCFEISLPGSVVSASLCHTAAFLFLSNDHPFVSMRPFYALSPRLFCGTSRDSMWLLTSVLCGSPAPGSRWVLQLTCFSLLHMNIEWIKEAEGCQKRLSCKVNNFTLLYCFCFNKLSQAPLMLKLIIITSLHNVLQSKCCWCRLSKSCLISLCRQTVKWITYFSRPSRNITYFQWEKALLTLATRCLC